MQRRLSWLALTGLALILPAASAPASVERGSTLFLWKATSATTEVYLLGSIHLGKKEFYPLANEIEGAFKKAKYLVVEADESKSDPAAVQRLVLENAMYPPDDGLSKHVSAETIKALAEVGTPLGLAPAATERMKPWLVALSLSVMSLQKLGYSPEFGIDRHFTKAAKDGGKEILELESMEYQIKLLAGFSPELQAKFLESTLAEAENVKDRMEKVVAAWSRGDTAFLEEEMLKKPIAKHPEQAELQAKLIEERNAGMAKKIGEYLKTKDVHFVVVGSAHLIGEKGIVRLLEKDGMKVQQVEKSE